MSPSRRYVVLALMSAFSLAGPSLHGQAPDAVRVIDFRLNLEDRNQSIGGSMVDGGRYQITVRGQGTWEVMGVVIGTREVAVTVFRATSPSAETMEETERVRATVGRAAALSSMGSVAIVIDEIRTVEPRLTSAAAPLLASTRPSRLPGESFSPEWCCVTCGNVTGCGCAVVHSCDSCCEEPCCGSPTITSVAQDRFFPASTTFVAPTSRACDQSVPIDERIFASSR
jgi:hypothetical protein